MTRSKHMVVGLGASAGGLEAFKTFFANTPANTGMTFIVVQHLAAQHKSLLVELLRAHTRMRIEEAADGTAIAPDCVFVIQPDATLTVKDGALRVAKPAPPRQQRWPVNALFFSLAEELGELAAGVILAGAGTDGTLGLKAIKEHGGFTLAQALADATPLQGMPHSAAATGLVDLVVPVEEMPAKLIQHQMHLRDVEALKGEDGTRDDVLGQLPQFSKLLRSRLGHDFTQYKEKTLVRRIQRRMQLLQVKTAPEYLKLLRRDGGEQRLLFHELLINVTQFFRDPTAYEVLEKSVIPQVIAQTSAEEGIRVWVPGCATGEEAFSLAILIKEAMVRQDTLRKVQIFATDLDDHAVASARIGRYPRSIAGDMSPERCERWFVKDGEDYCPQKAIREMCIFSVHDFTKDPPFSRLDLISCRNLFIYLNSDAQDRLAQVLHYALRPRGFLFMGSSEGIARHSKLFEVIDKKHRIFRRQAGEGAVPAKIVVPLAAGKRMPVAAVGHVHVLPDADRLERSILLQIAPSAVLINEHDEVIRYFGQTGRYLGPSPGVATLNLFQLLRMELRAPARSAAERARTERQPIVQAPILLGTNGGHQPISLTATPVWRGAADAPGNALVIVFRELGAPTAEKSGDDGSSKLPAPSPLEEELNALRSQLTTTVSELEVANEELKSSNEEYQSVNEELQSTNEELETAKEELQSTNEELQTVNSELSNKNDDLARANSDLRNFLDSTEIPTLFLDSQLRIKTFTPATTELLYLRDTDRGRPITELVSVLDYEHLEADVKRVLRTLSNVEREVNFREGREGTFILHIRPYRSIENVIDGVVVTFVDITQRKRAEASTAQLGRIVEESLHEIYVCGVQDLKFTFVNRGARENLGYTMDELRKLTPVDLKPEFTLETYRALIAPLLKGERDVITFEAVHRRKDRSRYPVEIRLSYVSDPPVLVANVIDISQRRLLARELAHRSKNMLSVIQSIVHQTVENSHTLDDFQEAFAGRLQALSASQDVLMREDWRGAPLATMVRVLLEPHEKKIEASGPDVTLNPDAAHYVGLALHELATNASKYGALSTPGGKVKIQWRLTAESDEQVELTWLEEGGPQVKPPKTSGFGRMLIKKLAETALDGKVDLEFAPKGVRWRLRFPRTQLLEKVQS